MAERHLTLVLPAFNEAHKIEADLEAWAGFLSSQPFASEIRVVDDGSVDGTRDRLLAIRSTWTSDKVAFFFESYSPNRGKGHALKKGVLAARGRFVVFADVGGCLAPDILTAALAMLDNHDVVIASRRHARSTSRGASAHRRLGSWVFRLAVKKVFSVPFEDTQCGFKAYRGNVARQLFAGLQTDGFMFDLEILMKARRQKLSIGELPVAWRTDPDTRYRLVSGSLRNVRELFRIWKLCRQ